MEIVEKGFSLSNFKQYRSARSPSSITQPRFSSCFANISAGLDSLPGEMTQTFIPEVSAVAQPPLSLSKEAPEGTAVESLGFWTNTFLLLLYCPEPSALAQHSQYPLSPYLYPGLVIPWVCVLSSQNRDCTFSPRM